MILHVREKERMSQRDIIARLAAMQYETKRARIQARHLPRARWTFWMCSRRELRDRAALALTDDEVDSLMLFDPLTGHASQRVPRFTVYPSSHYVTPRATTLRAVESDQDRARREDRALPTRRASSGGPAHRAAHALRPGDAERAGFCKGHQNYSRHLSGRKEGEPRRP